MKGLGLKRWAFGLASAAALAAGAQAAQAKVWHVNTTAALQNAVTSAANQDTIDVAAGHYVLSSVLTPSRNVSIAIVGAGSSKTIIDGNNAIQVFSIPATTTVKLQGVTVTGGNGSSGGDISNQGTLTVSHSTVMSGTASYGGDIDNTGALRIVDSTIRGGSAIQQAGGIDYEFGSTGQISGSTITGNQVTQADGAGGGGIYDQGSGLKITSSTIAGNSALSISSTNVGGGGIWDDDRSGLTIVNSTIAGNQAIAPPGSGSTAQGGGIYDNDDFGLAVDNVTIARNSSPDGANAYFSIFTPAAAPAIGGVRFQSPTPGFENTIIADPRGGPNCGEATSLQPTSNGHNLEDDAAGSCGFSKAQNDKVGVKPKLGALAANGGPTQTIALLPGSPAINGGASVAGVTKDQRGFARSVGGGPDIGAYEYGALVDVALAGSANSPVKVGNQLIYRLTASNKGPTTDAASPVKIVDTLPATVNFVSAASSSSCSAASGSHRVVCSIPSVPSGQKASVQIVVKPKQVGSLVDSASASSTGVDPTPANNTQKLTVSAQDVPTASTHVANPVLYKGATLHGSVNPNNAQTTYYFEYGPTTSYGSKTGSVQANGLTSKSVLATLTGLKPGKLYHYRLVAQNAQGTVRGRDRTLFTYYLPVVHVDPARVKPGDDLHVFGSVGECSAGSSVTVVSSAFSDAHMYQGQGAVYTTVQRGGQFSIHAQIPASRRGGSYKISAFCGHYPH